MENCKGVIYFGQPLENPLSLLGQYSDEDLDDGANEVAIKSEDKQAKDSVEPLEEGEIAGVEDHSSQKADNLDVVKDSSSVSASPAAEADAGGNPMVNLGEKDDEVSLGNQDHVSVASDVKTIGDMSSTWKMVLHEESNRYYYWNTVTGQTSWDVPDCLAQGTELTNRLDSLGAEIKDTTVGDVNAADAFGANLVDFSATKGVGYTMVNQSLGHSNVDGSQFHGGFSVVGAAPYEASSHGHYPLSTEFGGSYQGHDFSAFSNEQGAVDLPSHLVKHGEALLEKLKLMQGSVVDSTVLGWLSKYMLEIEIRLSDIRCLLPYGSLLVPFWVHSERQLSRLENAINPEIGEQHHKFSVLHESAEEEQKTNRESGGDASVDADKRKVFPENSITAVHDVDTPAKVEKYVHDESLNGENLKVKHTSQQVNPVHLHSENKGDRENNKAGVHEEASPNPEFQSIEDVDMDIDMEIEDHSPAMKFFVDVGGQLAAPSGQLVQPSAIAVGNPTTPESELIIPPPPEEEWIPPPPPDEGIPPPPPDEPPESLCPPPPPPEPEPVPPIYGEQPKLHNSTCINPNVNYYENTITESLGTRFYEHADANQIAAVNTPAYYSAISNAQPTSVVNPPDSVAYYGVPNGTLPVVPVSGTVGSSDFQDASDHSNYDPSLEHAGTVGAVTRESSLSKQSMDSLTLKTYTVQTQISSDAVASASASASTGAPVMGSTSVAVSGASASVSKVSSKASRVKKPKVAVASSLRSNKKVSSLVDKWMAAKEELQEEEKVERVTPLEALEKKRQREIEGWRAQQIASGEAKENANFQPLGGDWRERVKRRRAQKEAAVGTTSDSANNETKQPDLSELSRDLPPGWQAYWDDSSRQVYYGNSTTSETTWTRPTSG